MSIGEFLRYRRMNRVKKSNAEIIETIRKYHALTEREIQEKLQYREGSLDKRMKSLIVASLVKYIIIKSCSPSAKYKLFRGYTGTRLFFIENENLKEWILGKIPTKMSVYERSALTKMVNKELKIEM